MAKVNIKGILVGIKLDPGVNPSGERGNSGETGGKA